MPQAASDPFLSALDDVRRKPSSAAASQPADGDRAFQEWYRQVARATKINPNPDDARHFYDYRQAYASGVRGPDEHGHWPSAFKREGHPNLYITDERTGQRIDTRTGEPAPSVADRGKPSTSPSADDPFATALKDVRSAAAQGPRLTLGQRAKKYAGGVGEGLLGVGETLLHLGDPAAAFQQTIRAAEKVGKIQESRGLERVGRIAALPLDVTVAPVSDIADLIVAGEPERAAGMATTLVALGAIPGVGRRIGRLRTRTRPPAAAAEAGREAGARPVEGSTGGVERGGALRTRDAFSEALADVRGETALPAEFTPDRLTPAPERIADASGRVLVEGPRVEMARRTGPRSAEDLIDVAAESREATPLSESESRLARHSDPDVGGVFGDLLRDAREQGFEGSDLELRRIFDERVQAGREQVTDLADISSEYGPRAFLEAVREAGGISKHEAKLQGILDVNKPFGEFMGVRGVFQTPETFTTGQRMHTGREGKGRSLSQIAQALKQDPRWARMIDDELDIVAMFDEIGRQQDYRASGSIHEALAASGVEPGRPWWRTSADDVAFDVEGFETVAAGGGGRDVGGPPIGRGGEQLPGGGGEGGPPSRRGDLEISPVWSPSEAATAKILQPINEGGATLAGRIPEERLYRVPAWVPDELKSDYAAVLKRHAGFETERRGTMGAERRGDLAARVEVPTSAAVRPGVPLSAERFEAVKIAWESASNQLHVIEQRIREKTATDADLVERVALQNELRVLTQTAQTSVSEAGRALQAARGFRAVLESHDPDLIAGTADAVKSGKLGTYLAGNIFSGVSTAETNFGSNTLMLVADIVAEATVGGRPLAATAMAVGAVTGLPRGLKAFLYVMRHGRGLADSAVPVIDKLPINEFEFMGAANPWNIVLRSLRATDALAREMSKQSEINRTAYLEALKRGEGRGAALGKGMGRARAANPQWAIEAETIARNRTFTDPLGPWASAVANLRSRVPGLRYLMMVLRTASNLTKMAVETSPIPYAAVAVKQLKLADPALARLMLENSRRGQLARSRAALGTTIGAALTPLILEGRITGKGPDDDARRAVWLTQHQSYSFKPPGSNTWFSYRRFPAIAPFIASLADGYEAFREQATKKEAGRKFHGEQAVWTVVSRAARFVTIDQSFFATLGQFFDGLSGEPNKMMQAMDRVALMFDPLVAAQRSVAQTLDPVQRAPRGFAEEFRAVTPGLTTSVPPMVDAFGEIVKRQGTPFTQGFITTRTTPSDPLSTTLQSLDVPLSRPSGALELKDNLFADLTRRQETGLAQLRGRTRRAFLEDVLKDPRFFFLSPEEQRARLEAAKIKAGQLVSGKTREAYIRELLLKWMQQASGGTMTGRP